MVAETKRSHRKLAGLEGPDLGAPDVGVKPKPHLVDRSTSRKVIGELAAPVDDQIAGESPSAPLHPSPGQAREGASSK